jgi:hypothetical protein
MRDDDELDEVFNRLSIVVDDLGWYHSSVAID